MADSERQMKPGDKVLVRATVETVDGRLMWANPSGWVDKSNPNVIPLATPEEVRAMAEGAWDMWLSDAPMDLVEIADDETRPLFIAGFEAAYRRLTGGVGK